MLLDKVCSENKGQFRFLKEGGNVENWGYKMIVKIKASMCSTLLWWCGKRRSRLLATVAACCNEWGLRALLPPRLRPHVVVVVVQYNVRARVVIYDLYLRNDEEPCPFFTQYLLFQRRLFSCCSPFRNNTL